MASTDGGEARGIDPERGMIARGIDVGKGPSRLASHGNVLVVPLAGNGAVSLFDTVSGSGVGGYKLDGGPRGVAANLDYLVVVRPDAGRVTRIQHGRAPSTGITISADRIFVATAKGPTVHQISIDPAAPTILMSRPLGQATTLDDRAGADVTVYNSRVWVSSYAENTVYGLVLPRRMPAG